MFTIPTLDEQHELLLALARNLFANLNGGKGLNLAKGSFWWLFLRTVAGAVTDNHANIFSLVAELLPDGALDELLDRWGAIRGVKRKPATPARKTAALKVFGTATTSVDAGELLSHTSGLQFEVTKTDLVGPGEYVLVDIECTTAGSATRLGKGEHLTFAITPVGLQEDAVLVLDLDDGGEDLESNGAYRARILNRFATPPGSGNANDYVQWALEVPDIAEAFCYPRRGGIGSVDLVALHAGSGSDRIPTTPTTVDVKAYVDTKRPVSTKDFRVLLVTEHQVDVDVTLLTDGAPQHAWDWDDTTPPTVLTYDVPTRTVQLAADLPADLEAGDRIVIKPIGGGGTGATRIVESLTDTDKFIVEPDPDEADPAIGDTLYAGGALTEPVRAALRKLAFDSLGPANPDAKHYGPWEGNLDPDALSSAARTIAGVKRATVVAPGALVAAADPAIPNDDSIELLTPRRILVRAAH